MKRLLALGILVLVSSALVASAADDEAAKREKRIQETRVWITNQFVPWLTNEFPEVTTKVYPDWFVNPFSRTRLPTWLTNTFPQIDTEEFPHWLDEPDEEMLSKGLPEWWGDAMKRVPTVPVSKPLPAIVRGP